MFIKFSDQSGKRLKELFENDQCFKVLERINKRELLAQIESPTKLGHSIINYKTVYDYYSLDLEKSFIVTGITEKDGKLGIVIDIKDDCQYASVLKVGQHAFKVYGKYILKDKKAHDLISFVITHD